MIRERDRFQLEATKLGRSVVFQVTVFERSEGGARRLFAETQCPDPAQFLVQFVVRRAASFEELLATFARQLEHRGFEPVRHRLWVGETWAEWRPTGA